MRYFLLVIVVLCLGCNTQQTVQQSIEWLSLPASDQSALPYLDAGLDGQLRCAWVETSGDTAILKFSTLQNEKWSSPESIAQGTNWFVNWADFPKIAASKEGMIATYLQKSAPDTYAYDIMAKVRDQSGWGEPFKLHGDTTRTEHGFVSLVPLPDNQFQVAWLDGRNTAGSHTGAMTLRTGVVDLQGQVTDTTLLDNRVCDCCATAMTLSGQGPIVAYRDRSQAEIRDIYVTRLEQQQWTVSESAYDDRWEIEGCPVNGPHLDSYGKTTVLGWYTGANNTPAVKLAFANKTGAGFETPILIDDERPLGRVAVTALTGNRAAISWLGRFGEQVQIRLKVVNRTGSALKEMVIAETSESRNSGFPQLTASDGYLYIAFTLSSPENSMVKVGRLKI